MLRHSKIASQSGRTSVWMLVAGIGLVLAGIWFFWNDPKSEVAEGQAAWARRDFEGAAAILDRSVSTDPTPEAIYAAAVVHADLKNVERATALLDRLVVHKEWKSRFYYFAVHARLRAKALDDARKFVSAQAANYKAYPLAHEAEGLYELDQTAASEAAAKRLIAERIGPARAGTYDDRIRRIVAADAGVFARSLDQFLDRLRQTEEFADVSDIRPPIEEAHKHALAAVNAFERAIKAAETEKSDPDPIRARFELGAIHMTRGRGPESADHFRSVVDTPVEALKGDFYFREKRDGLVLAARKNLAELLVRSKKLKEAVEVLKGVPANARTGFRPYDIDVMLADIYQKMGASEHMLEVAKPWIEKDRTLYSMNYFIGKDLFDRGRYSEAVSYLERARFKRQTDEEYTKTLVECYLKLGRWQYANGLADSLINIEPKKAEYYVYQAQAFEGLGWVDDVRNFLVKSMKRRFPEEASSGHKYIRAWLDEFIVRNRLMPKTLEEADRAYTEDPSNYRVAARYVELLTAAKNYRTARAVEQTTLAELPVDHPDYPDFTLACARLAAINDRPLDARKRFADVIKRRPTDVEAYVGLAEAERKLGRFGLAIDALEKALLLDPANIPAARLRFAIHVAEADWAEAAELGQKLAKIGEKEPAFLLDAAVALVRSGRTEEAEKSLDRLRSTSLDLDLALKLGALFFESGRVQDGERQLVRLIEEEPGDQARALRAGEILLREKRHEALVKALEAPARAAPETAGPLWKLIASASLARGDDEALMQALARLHGLGERAWVYERLSAACIANGNVEEALSIITAAKTEDVLDPGLMIRGIETAVAARDPGKASEFAALLERAEAAPKVEAAIAIARTHAAMKDAPRVMNTMKAARENATPAEKSRLYAAEMEMLGRLSWLDKMMEIALEADRTLTASSGLATVAAEAMMLNDFAQKGGRSLDAEIVKAAVERDGAGPRTLLNRGLVTLGLGGGAAAIEDFEAAWKAEKSAETGHALALTAAALGKKELADTVLRQRPQDAIALFPSTLTAARFLTAIFRENAKDAPAEIAALPFPSSVERDEFASAMRAALARPDVALEAKEAMLKVFVFSAYERTTRKAVGTLGALMEKLPEHAGAFDAMAARLEIRADWSYSAGIQRATRRMKDADDETAYLIYAESYVRNGDWRALTKLIDYILAARSFRPQFLRDMAGVLLESGAPKDAARLLFTLTDPLPEDRAEEAWALYRSGHLDRAAQILLGDRDLKTTARTTQIMADFRSGSRETLEEAFRLAADAVYRHTDADKSAALVLARIAAKRGFQEEAEKAVRRYIAMQPTSARACALALEALADGGPGYGALRDQLELRRDLLDPSSRLRSK